MVQVTPYYATLDVVTQTNYMVDFSKSACHAGAMGIHVTCPQRKGKWGQTVPFWVRYLIIIKEIYTWYGDRIVSLVVVVSSTNSLQAIKDMSLLWSAFVRNEQYRLTNLRFLAQLWSKIGEESKPCRTSLRTKHQKELVTQPRRE